MQPGGHFVMASGKKGGKTLHLGLYSKMFDLPVLRFRKPVQICLVIPLLPQPNPLLPQLLLPPDQTFLGPAILLKLRFDKDKNQVSPG